MYEIKTAETIKIGWAHTKSYGGIILGAGAIYLLIAVVSLFIPFFYFSKTVFYFYSKIVGILFLSPLSAGACFMILKAFRGIRPGMADLFQGFKLYSTIIVIGFLLTVANDLIQIPAYLYEFLSNQTFGYLNYEGMTFEQSLVHEANNLISFLLLIRFQFVYFVVFDDPSIGAIKALKKSSDIVKGNYTNLVVFYVACFFLLLVGFLLLIIPGIILSLVMYISLGYIYVRLLDNYNYINNIASPYNQSPPPNDQQSPDHPYGQ